jgi:hypothetical protein
MTQDTGIVTRDLTGNITLFSRKIEKDGVKVEFSYYDAYYFVSNADRMPGLYVTPKDGHTYAMRCETHPRYIIDSLDLYLEDFDEYLLPPGGVM